MCKGCEVLIGCSCYCKNEWKSLVQHSKQNKMVVVCSKCNHSMVPGRA